MSQNKQVQIVSPEKPEAEPEVYTWSTIRVAEGIAVNVGSAIALGILTAIVAFVPSLLILLLQQVTGWLAIIPTHWLQLAALIGGSVLGTLLLVILAFYIYMRRHPTIVGMMLLGVLVGAFLEKKTFNFNFDLSGGKAKQPQQSDLKQEAN